MPSTRERPEEQTRISDRDDCLGAAAAAGSAALSLTVKTYSQDQSQCHH